MNLTMISTPQKIDNDYFFPDFEDRFFECEDWEYFEVVPGPFQGPHLYIPNPEPEYIPWDGLPMII
jgi:hypothetical protein